MLQDARRAVRSERLAPLGDQGCGPEGAGRGIRGTRHVVRGMPLTLNMEL